MKDLGHSLRQTGAATKAAHVTRTACNTANCRARAMIGMNCSLKIGTGGSRLPEESQSADRDDATAAPVGTGSTCADIAALAGFRSARKGR